MAEAHPIPTRPSFNNLSGLRFGRLLVISFGGVSKRSLWNCRCDCGKLKTVIGFHLISGNTKSCGCFHSESAYKTLFKHGGRYSPEYESWCKIKGRCLNNRDAAWSDYGGRGITIAKEWVNSFESFLSSVGKRPSPQHSIDRINNNGNYEPGNVRWSTKSEQARNRRSNNVIAFNGIMMTLVGWSEKTGLSRVCISKRLKLGWSIERTLTTPTRIKLKQPTRQWL